jgi:hypothetical protein
MSHEQLSTVLYTGMAQSQLAACARAQSWLPTFGFLPTCRGPGAIAIMLLTDVHVNFARYGVLVPDTLSWNQRLNMATFCMGNRRYRPMALAFLPL